MRGRDSRSFIAICMWCGKTRTASGSWRRQKQAASAGGEVELTHGICPDCEKKMSDDLEKFGTA